MSTASATFSHDPVMVREITELFANVPDGVVLDATLGGAGHTTALLNAHPGLRVLGLDRDPAALEASRARLAPYGDRAMLQHRRFDDLDAAMLEAGIDELSGALFDLGVYLTVVGSTLLTISVLGTVSRPGSGSVQVSRGAV